MVLRLPVEFGDEIGPSGGKLRGRPSLLGAARRAAGDIDEHDRQAAAAEGVGQGAGAFHHLVDRMRGGEGDDAFLQVDHDEGGYFCHLGEAIGFP